MIKHTQTIGRQKPANCLSVFDHFVGLALKGLRHKFLIQNINKMNYVLSTHSRVVPPFNMPWKHQKTKAQNEL